MHELVTCSQSRSLVASMWRRPWRNHLRSPKADDRRSKFLVRETRTRNLVQEICCL